MPIRRLWSGLYGLDRIWMHLLVFLFRDYVSGIPCFIWGYAVVLFQQKNAMNPKRDGRLLILSLILYTVEFWSIVGLTGNTHIRSLLSTHFVTFS